MKGRKEEGCGQGGRKGREEKEREEVKKGGERQEEGGNDC